MIKRLDLSSLLQTWILDPVTDAPPAVQIERVNHLLAWYGRRSSTAKIAPVSYTHLQLPTNREV